MRVMLYFVAFGFLFAFVIPILIGAIIQDDEQVAWRIRQGVDPTTILEETAAGNTEGNCETEGYHFHITGDGYPYVQKQNTPYIAALIKDRVVILKVDNNENLALPVVEKKRLPDDMSKLSSILETCIESDKNPGITEIMLQKEK